MLLKLASVRPIIVRSIRLGHQSFLPRLPSRHISQVKQLPTWALEPFKQEAFNAQTPVKLPSIASSIPPACRKWFIHNNNPSEDTDLSNPPPASELRTAFWSDHESTLVPLELTTRAPSPHSTPSTNNLTTKSTFIRTEAPLKLLLSYLSNPSHSSDTPSPNPSTDDHPSIYLAQCDLTSLPTALQTDLPIPDLVTSAGKGDIYSSSLWLGRPPTYTPLHRDPNPNLFLQLAGWKVVRLLPPEVGDAVFEDVQQRVRGGGGSSSRFRGDEMMVGEERELLHRMVWEEADGAGEGGQGGLGQYMAEVKLGLGEALFIPKGWWHSVKGVGEGVTASANWWFR